MKEKRMVLRWQFAINNPPVQVFEVAELVNAKVITPKEARDMLFEWEK